jgi:DNA-binding GntR family transcriptional regulator
MELIRTESLVDAAATRLRNAILAGELQPGEPVRVRDLQKRMGISHIPIREAIRQLEGEGLIVAPPRRTPVVAGVGLDDLAAIYELRRMIELPTIRLARERATHADVRKLREAFAAFESFAMETQSTDYWRRHDDFHWALLEPGANLWTRRVLDPLWTGAERYVRLFVSQYATPAETLRLHRALIETFELGDPDQVANSLDDHFAETERVVRAGFEETQQTALSTA